MARELTERQRDVLGFIAGHTAEHGYPPTLKEIAAHFGMASPNAAREHLRALEEKGHLQRTAEKSRALRLVGGIGDRGLPLIGEVAAGSPLLAEENFQGTVDLGSYFGRDPSTFVLRVKGQSMVGAGIRDGDLVVVHHQPTLQSGEIGVVYLGQEATVKRVFIEGERVRLQPENEAMSPVWVATDDPDFRVGGKVVGVIRKLG